MKPRLVPRHLHLRGKGRFGQRFQKLRPQELIAPLHPADMLFKVALGEKPRQGELLEAGHRAAIKPQLFPIPRQKRRGQNEIADAQRRGDGLGEGVEVDNRCGYFKTWENGYRFALC